MTPRIRHRFPRLSFVLLLLLLLAGCAGKSGLQEGRLAASAMAESDFSGPGLPADRRIIRTADLRIEVDDLQAGRTAAEQAVATRGGYVESVRESEDSLYLQLRVPAADLDAFLEELSGLGRVEHASVSARDVTEEHADLSVRLANNLKLRDRLQQLLDKATTVEEILAVEKELARVQSEVEMLQGRLERLDSQIALSTVSLTLERAPILGPLGYVGYGVYWVVEKLFIIRR